jgi:hypothetical protein
MGRFLARPKGDLGLQITNILALFVQIISGQNFPKPKGSAAKGDVTDPYVTIEVFGIPADCAEERTKTVPHNGISMRFFFLIKIKFGDLYSAYPALRRSSRG